MTQRIEGGQTYAQNFDGENRLTSVVVGGQTTTFVYDGDGTLIKKVKPDGSSTLYLGVYEIDLSSGGSATKKTSYYPGGAMRVDVVGGSNTLYYSLKDHLGSASVVLDSSGVLIANGEQRYYPYGEKRITTAALPTDRLYTGQLELASLGGIYHYGARYYSPRLGRFLSADSIVPNFANPQSLNRFSYAYNNPLRYNDPTGHCTSDPDDPCKSRGRPRPGPSQPPPSGPPSCNSYYCAPQQPPGGGGGGNGGGGNGGNSGGGGGSSGNDDNNPPCNTQYCGFLDPVSGSSASAYDVGLSWLTGRGPRRYQFRAGDPFTENLRKHWWIDIARGDMAINVGNGDYSGSVEGYSLEGREGIGKYLSDSTAIATGGRTGNLAATYLGSYGIEYQTLSVDQESGSAEVLIHVHNSSTFASGFRVPIVGYWDVWQQNVDPFLNAPFGAGVVC